MDKSNLSDISPLITIVTVVFNNVATMEKTIQSILNQSYKNIEYIIIDGGSSDGTLDIIKKYNDRISCWISEKDIGIYDAMNKSLKYITGDWVIFINADDHFVSPFVLSNIISSFRKSNTIYYGDILFDGKVFYGGKFNAFRMSRMNISHQSIFYPRSVFSTYQYFYDLNYNIRADHDLNLRLFGNSSLRFKYIPNTISVCSSGGYSSKNIDNHFERDRLDIIKKNLGILPFLYKKMTGLLHSFC